MSMFNADNPATLIAHQLMNENANTKSERMLQEQKQARAKNITALTESVRKQYARMSIAERTAFIADIQK